MKTLSSLALSLALGAFGAAATLPATLVPAAAQTSFGKDRAAPTDAAAWDKDTQRRLLIGLRNANSALDNVPGGTNPVVVFTILRDGRVADMQMLQSSGRASLDKAILRAFARVTAVAPFTPDMPDEEKIMVMSLGVTRN